MLNYFQAALILLVIWCFAYIILKRKLITSKIYFGLLLLMCGAGICLPLDTFLDLGTDPRFSPFNITIFAILLITAIYPWVIFDNYYKKSGKYVINRKSITFFRFVFIGMIILAIYAISYSLPYAIIGYKLGAAQVRAIILDDSILPKSPLTTIAVGVGILAPIYIVMFYISLLDNNLRKYSLPLFIGSLTYLVTSAAAQARDGFILIPLTYVFLYLVFKKSLSEESILTLHKYAKLVIPIGLTFLLIITISRFYSGKDNPIISFIDGTWGYFYQQPYVFDQTIQHQTHFHGVGYRFPLFAKILDLPAVNDRFLNYKFEWMFGTMYATFYSANGWTSLIIFTCCFMFSWAIAFKILNKNKNYLGLLIVFALYLYHLISGLFYFRFSAISIMSTYLLVIFASFFLKNKIIIYND